MRHIESVDCTYQGRERISNYDEFDEVVANHWSIPLLDSPHALVSVIETKIARAALSERKRIITLLEEMNCHGDTAIQCDCGSYWEAIALIKGENE